MCCLLLCLRKARTERLHQKRCWIHDRIYQERELCEESDFDWIGVPGKLQVCVECVLLLPWQLLGSCNGFTRLNASRMGRLHV